jgi:hypothetical protein
MEYFIFIVCLALIAAPVLCVWLFYRPLTQKPSATIQRAAKNIINLASQLGMPAAVDAKWNLVAKELDAT